MFEYTILFVDTGSDSVTKQMRGSDSGHSEPYPDVSVVLNELGGQGWELAGTYGAGNTVKLILKRQRRDTK